MPPTSPRDWTAERWAEWAAGFLGLHEKDGSPHSLLDSDGDIATDACGCLCGWRCEVPDHSAFDPLHDANHLMLVLDELTRRGHLWELSSEGTATANIMSIWERIEDEKLLYRAADTRNLAVLLATKALEATA